MSESAEDIAKYIAPSIQDFMRSHRDELIASGHWGPGERIIVRRMFPHFVCMVPTVVKEVVQAVLDKLGKS